MAEELSERERTLIDAAHCFHWMARRYADMRSSYAPNMFNGHVRALRRLGFGLKHPLFARDGMGRTYDGLTDEEVADAAEDMPRGFVPDPDPLLEALRDIADMPERGGCDDEITAVELWRLMQKRARKAIDAVEGFSATEQAAPVSGQGETKP